MITCKARLVITTAARRHWWLHGAPEVAIGSSLHAKPWAHMVVLKASPLGSREAHH